MTYTPIALSIAGSDSSGGAGIQADLKTFSALGVYGCSAITALTAQNTQGVQSVMNVDANFVQQQITSLQEDMVIDAVKIGMLSSLETTQAVIQACASFQQVVLDPVMVSSSGKTLLAEDAIDTVKRLLLPKIQLITPNLPEAAVLTRKAHAQTQTAMIDTAKAVHDLGVSAVLLKGGHLENGDSADLFYDGSQLEWFVAPRFNTKNTHGTGCTLSSAITAGLAKGMTLLAAIAAAKQYMTQAIQHADDLNIGKGHGPVHHFHQWW